MCGLSRSHDLLLHSPVESPRIVTGSNINVYSDLQNLTSSSKILLCTTSSTKMNNKERLQSTINDIFVVEWCCILPHLLIYLGRERILHNEVNLRSYPNYGTVGRWYSCQLSLAAVAEGNELALTVKWEIVTSPIDVKKEEWCRENMGFFVLSHLYLVHLWLVN